MVNAVRAVSSNPASALYNASAPSLTGQAGSLTTLLDALLVNGFSGYTAAGWSIAQTTTSKRGYLQATGGNNTAGMCLWVDDSAVTTAKEARVTGFETMTGLGTGTGQFPTTGQGVSTTTPNAALIIRKSTTADATARFYTFIGDGHTFYLFVETGDQTTATVNGIAAFPFVFGDFFPAKSGDQYAVAIVGRNIENSASPSNDWLHMIGTAANAAAISYTAASTMAGHYVARSWTGVGGSIAIGHSIDQIKMGQSNAAATTTPYMSGGWNNNSGSQTTVGATASIAIGRNQTPTSFPYPNGPDGGLYMSPIWINHSNSIRGYFKGLWAPLHDRPLAHGDTFSGTGNLNGKSFVAQNITAYVQGATDTGQIMIETSNTWT